MATASISTPRVDIYTRVTNRIVEQLEQGIRPWMQPWNAEHAAGRITRPLRHNGEPYKGIKISEITDGTSNTILVVEARRNCPWMKPDDIPFDADKPAPELGGFVENKFAAVMADGRACLFERSKVEEILNLMIRRNDGHPIKIPFE